MTIYNGTITWKITWQFFIKLNVVLHMISTVTLIGICANELKTWSHKNVPLKFSSSLVINAGTRSNEDNFISEDINDKLFAQLYNRILLMINK